MAKSIYFSDERYDQIVAAARDAGFQVGRGPASQLAQFVVMLTNATRTAEGKAWISIIADQSLATQLDELAEGLSVTRDRLVKDLITDAIAAHQRARELQNRVTKAARTK